MICVAMISRDGTFVSIDEVGTTIPIGMKTLGILPVDDSLSLKDKVKDLRTRTESVFKVDFSKVIRFRFFTKKYCSQYIGVNA